MFCILASKTILRRTFIKVMYILYSQETPWLSVLDRATELLLQMHSLRRMAIYE